MTLISVVNYGVGNLRSIKKGLEKTSAKVTITRNSKDMERADGIVLPGVGAFEEAMTNLSPLTDTITQLTTRGKPLLGICLGLQLLFTRSSEGESKKGLGLILGEVLKLPTRVKTPQIGWNTVDIVQQHPFLEGIPNPFYAYFVHSYFPHFSEQRFCLATVEYGIRFPAVIAKQNIYATQFHPEKSSKIGLKILNNFIKIVKR